MIVKGVMLVYLARSDWMLYSFSHLILGRTTPTGYVPALKRTRTAIQNIRQLYSYGIRGSMLKWMESYLTDRSQYVVFDSKVSETHGIKCGVSQGSILGPLLFIISVNNICNVSPMLFKILYADDTCVLISGNHLNDLIDRLNTMLISLNNWF